MDTYTAQEGSLRRYQVHDDIWDQYIEVIAMSELEAIERAAKELNDQICVEERILSLEDSDSLYKVEAHIAHTITKMEA